MARLVATPRASASTAYRTEERDHNDVSIDAPSAYTVPPEQGRFAVCTPVRKPSANHHRSTRYLDPISKNCASLSSYRTATRSPFLSCGPKPKLGEYESGFRCTESMAKVTVEPCRATADPMMVSARGASEQSTRGVPHAVTITSDKTRPHAAEDRNPRDADESARTLHIVTSPGTPRLSATTPPIIRVRSLPDLTRFASEPMVPGRGDGPPTDIVIDRRRERRWIRL
jgi:hypothetical protein